MAASRDIMRDRRSTICSDRFSVPHQQQIVPMQTLTIRTALASDQKLLEALQWRASLNNPGDREALLANPDAIELPLQQIAAGGVFVAEDADAIKGFAAILPRDDGDSELDALFVEPDTWRQGIGRALVEHCCSAAKATGAGSLHVVGNPHAEHFYTSCGFKTIGRQQTRFGVGLLMKRALQ
jgi:N-acetylglutamate synthase-like GNAT family acetyltransferase